MGATVDQLRESASLRPLHEALCVHIESHEETLDRQAGDKTTQQRYGRTLLRDGECPL